MHGRSILFAVTLLVAPATIGCGWVKPTKGGEAPGEAGAADAAAFAPPEGLPDMRPIVGIDPNHWAPAFLPAVTQQMSEKDLLAEMTDFEVVETTEGEVKFVAFVPKDPKKFAGLKWLRLTFQNDEGKSNAYSAELHFARSIRHQAAFKEYLVHLCRMNYGPITDELASEEIITIIGDDGSVQLTDHAEGMVLDITFPNKAGRGKGSKPPTPKYSAVVTIDEADYAPPEGKPDARVWMGVDPDHWGPAFLPKLRRGLPEKEALALFEDFELVDPPEKGDSTFVRFAPKKADALPGVKSVRLYIKEDEDWKGRGLYSIQIEIDEKLGEDEAYYAYLAKLGELNYGGKEPEDPKEGSSVMWISDNSAGAQLTSTGLDITLPRF